MENNEFKVGDVTYRIVPIDDVNERGIDFGGMADGIGEAAKLVAESVIVLKGNDLPIVKAAKVTKLVVGFVADLLKLANKGIEDKAALRASLYSLVGIAAAANAIIVEMISIKEEEE